MLMIVGTASVVMSHGMGVWVILANLSAWFWSLFTKPLPFFPSHYIRRKNSCQRNLSARKRRPFPGLPAGKFLKRD